jgi:hypothetical protein
MIAERGPALVQHDLGWELCQIHIVLLEKYPLSATYKFVAQVASQGELYTADESETFTSSAVAYQHDDLAAKVAYQRLVLRLNRAGWTYAGANGVWADRFRRRMPKN